MENNEPTVEFEEEDNSLQMARPTFEKKGMIGFVIKHSGGLIKDEKGANIVLMLLVIILVIITFTLVLG